MTSILTHAQFATVEQLFDYKEQKFSLPPFPGYSDDQWGIKAHNRPWIEATGAFKKGERIAEVGGAYSLLPEYLSDRYGTESTIIDDFGGYSNETDMWQRWGNPDEWIAAHPKVNYIKHPVGFFRKEIPDNYFDCIFSVSTLEHIPKKLWPAVFKDMLRITKPGGRQIHTIDIPLYSLRKSLQWLLWSAIPFTSVIRSHPLREWKSALKAAGVNFEADWPSMLHMFDRALLIESSDVIFRFYPPINKRKIYPSGGFSLLIQFTKTK